MPRRPSRNPELNRLYVAAGLAALSWIIFKAYKLLSAQLETGLDNASRWALLALGLANVLAIGTLIFIVARSLAKVYFERRSGILGARIRTRLVLALLMVGIIPSVILFLVGRNFISKNVDRWFKPETRQVILDGHHLSELVREQVKRRLSAASDLAPSLGGRGPEAVRTVLEVDGIALPGPEGQTVVSVREGLQAPPLRPGEAAEGIFETPAGTWMLTPIHLASGEKSGWAGVFLEAEGGDALARLEKRYQEAGQVDRFREPLETLPQLTFLFLTLLNIFAAVWVGLTLSRTISEPVRALAKAALRVGTGDLDTLLPEQGEDELAFLSKSFNLMTRDLRASREAIEDQAARINRQRAYLEQLLEALPVGVLSWQRDGVLRTFNTTARRWLGMEALKGEEADWQALSRDPRLGGLPPLVERVRQTRSPMQEELRLGGEGKGRPVRAMVVPLAGDGELAVLEDLSLLAQAEKQAAWQEVARRMAHEVKNPLTPIKLTAQRLARRSREGRVEPASVLEGVETILHEVASLSRLVDSFSRFAKLPSPQPAPLDPCELLRQIHALYAPVHPGVQWELQLPEQAPAASWDADMVKRALINFVDNALGALAGPEGVEGRPAHPPRGLVRLSLAVEGEGLRLAVEDNGPGVPAESRERIFEPYFSMKRKGTGLGLAIVRKIAHDHRGEADYTPLEQGSRFSLWLPLDAGGRGMAMREETLG